VTRTWPLRVLAVLAVAQLHGSLTAAVPGQRADVLIVEIPSALTIYDVYQQRLTTTAERLIPPFVPMVIEAEKTTLSDGFTPCMNVLINGTRFFLLRDQGGDVAGLSGAGFSHIFRNVDIVDDSIRVRDGHLLHITSPDRSSSRELHAGEVIRRSFRDRTLSYCQASLTSFSYGWVTLSPADERKVWEFIRATPAATVLSATMVSSIRQRVERANRIVRSLFSAFNEESRTDRDAPYWSVTVKTDGLSCTPDDSSLGRHFQKSIHQLSKEIEAVLIGTPYRVVEGEGSIEVVRSGDDGEGP
jgi:hypothetical protein